MPTAALAGQSKTELQELITNFETAKDLLQTQLVEIHGEWEDEISEKSEKWSESEAGKNAQARLETLLNWIDALDQIEIPDLKDLT